MYPIANTAELKNPQNPAMLIDESMYAPPISSLDNYMFYIFKSAWPSNFLILRHLKGVTFVINIVTPLKFILVFLFG